MCINIPHRHMSPGSPHSWQSAFFKRTTAGGLNKRKIHFRWDFAKQFFGTIPSHFLFVSDRFSRNWVVVQWSTHALNLLRYINLSKFLGFRTIYTEEEVPTVWLTKWVNRVVSCFWKNSSQRMDTIYERIKQIVYIGIYRQSLLTWWFILLIYPLVN